MLPRTFVAVTAFAAKAVTMPLAPAPSTDLNVLDARGQKPTDCFGNYQFANGYAHDTNVMQGTEYLSGIQGTMWMDPHSCSRVSCAYNAAIYVCNDNDFNKEIAWADITQTARSITHDCTRTDVRQAGGKNGPGFNVVTHTIKGQKFDDGGWNVVVGSERC